MNTLEGIFRDLVEESPLAKNIFSFNGNVPPSISRPIDSGAVALLQPFTNAFVTYPPLEVEYLIQTLNEHLNNCLDLRLKGQDLEVKAFIEASEQLLQRKLLDTVQNQIKLVAENEPKLLANTVNAKYGSPNGDKTSGTVSGDTNIDYWRNVLKEQEAQMRLKIQDSDMRLERLGEAGSGTNYVARFEFLKKLFDLDLIEAYSRARSASLGLKAIYGIDASVPPVSDIGYLDSLVLWARSVTYELEKRFFNIRETVVAFALHDGTPVAAPPVDLPRIMSQDDFNASRTAGSFVFTISEAFFNRANAKFKNPRLKGLDVHIWVNDTKDTMHFWRVLAKLPFQKVSIAPGVPPYVYEPKVFVPLATYPKHIRESLELANHREVHNVSPIGEWTLRIEPKSIMGVETNTNDNVGNIIIRMRIVYDKD